MLDWWEVFGGSVVGRSVVAGSSDCVDQRSSRCFAGKADGSYHLSPIHIKHSVPRESTESIVLKMRSLGGMGCLIKFWPCAAAGK